MHIDEIIDVISAGMCRGDKVAECSTCQRKLRAIEAVRAMGAAARVPPSIRKRYTELRSSHRCEIVPGTREPCECDWCRWVDALDAAEADR